MKEEILHYIWRYQLFVSHQFLGDKGEKIQVVKPGTHNKNEGPDFLNAQILVDGLSLHGAIEIHNKSTDWIAHKHFNNKHYDQVILHVVYDLNGEIFLADGTKPIQVEMKEHISNEIFHKAKLLLDSKNFIPCKMVRPRNTKLNFSEKGFLERLIIERYEKRAALLENKLKDLADWPQLFCWSLFRAFGATANKDAFGLLGQFCNHKILLREAKSLKNIEALLFGISGLLSHSAQDKYHESLQEIFHYQEKKYSLSLPPKILWNFSKMRPVNFPSIKIAQLAHLIYLLKGKLFGLIEVGQINEWVNHKVAFAASDYWRKHTHFGRESKKIPVMAGKQLKNNLLLNAILPFHFFYHKKYGQIDFENYASWLGRMSPEKNKVTRAFEKMNICCKNALESQAILQLHKEYCILGGCLRCFWGHKILCGK